MPHSNTDITQSKISDKHTNHGTPKLAKLSFWVYQNAPVTGSLHAMIEASTSKDILVP